MGKRELLLIGAFVVVGVAVYYATAPAATPGQQGLAISRILDHVRREIRGNRSSAEVRTATAYPIRPGLAEVRLETAGAPLKITGEDRSDLSCELAVNSTGYDEAEARHWASETKLKVTDAGASLVIGIDYPEPATQRANLVLRIPKQLAIRIQPSRARIEMSNVASAELVDARGQVTVRGVAGRLAVTHRGGPLTIEDVSTLKLNTRGSVVAVKDIKGEATLQLQAGELRGTGLEGPLEIESNGSKIILEDVSATRRPLRINAVGGSIELTGVRTEIRIDGRDTEIDVKIDKPAPVAIYNDADEWMRVTMPPGGYVLDAMTTHGRLTVPPDFLEVKTTDNEQRVSGTVKGGGPTITLRASRGSIEIRPANPHP
jgi:hypothetical protein